MRGNPRRHVVKVGVAMLGLAGLVAAGGGTALASSATSATAPVVATSATTTGGYELAGADGGVFDFGNAGFYGSTYSDGLTGLHGAHALAAPIVGIASTPDRRGYWMVGADGGVFNFGNAGFYGSTYSDGLSGLGGAHPLRSPIVGIASTPDGKGYWLVAKDGFVYSFGDADYYGDIFSDGLTGLSGPHPLSAPIVGIAATPDGQGYWLVGADGGVFNFGDASYYGNTYSDGLTGLSGPHPLSAPIVGIAATPDGQGYWLVGADGGVFNFGNAQFHGSTYSDGMTGLGGAHPLQSAVVAIASTQNGLGYRVVTKAGMVYDFGSANFDGDTFSLGLTGLGGAHPLSAPIVGIAQ